MLPSLKSIEPLPQRWEPAADPNNIVVPGLDASAPVYDQIEQIEQLITIRLQNIDTNFSRMQHVMANRILPAVKRYAVGTEPVREAARFWTTFFETAAQIRVPAYEDQSSVHDQGEDEPSSDIGPAQADESTTGPEDVNATPTRSHHTTYHSEGSSSEVSFMPQAALSSTPATTSRYRAMNPQHSLEQPSQATPSWTASLESPFARLGREVESLSHGDEVSVLSERTAGSNESQEASQRPIPLIEVDEGERSRASAKGKGKDDAAPEPLLQNVLRRNASYATSPRKPAISPLKFKQKTPVLKTMNPYLAPGTKPAEWKGVIDLASPSTTPRTDPVPPTILDVTARPTMRARPARPATPKHSADDSLDVDFGMSPPITMDFARLPKLGKTPKKEAAERILHNLIDIEKRGVSRGVGDVRVEGKGSGVESSASSMPTPPSLSRYHRDPVGSDVSGSVAAPSIDSIMRRVGLNVVDFSSNTLGSVAAGPTASVPTRDSQPPSAPSVPTASMAKSGPFRAPAPAAPPPPATPPVPQFDLRHVRDDDLDGNMIDGGLDDSLDSMDSGDYEEHNTANPSAAFLLASQRGPYDDDDDDDDSFASDDTDDFADQDEGGAGAGADEYPQDEGDGFDDDSFDDEFDGPPEEETVFGVPPAARMRLSQPRDSESNLRMFGAELLQDTVGVGSQMAQAGRVEDTPTPFVTGR